MRRLAIGLLWGAGGYVVGVVVGYLLINTLSSNTHDRSLEAVMTGFFLFGPLAALIAFVAGAIRGGKRV